MAENRFLYVVSSRRDFFGGSTESYSGADSLHLTHDEAVKAILSDMDETLREDFCSYSIDEVDVDRSEFVIASEDKRFSWSIDPIAMPAGLALVEP